MLAPPSQVPPGRITTIVHLLKKPDPGPALGTPSKPSPFLGLVLFIPEAVWAPGALRFSLSTVELSTQALEFNHPK